MSALSETSPKTYTRPCKWCILHRPGCAPNMLQVAVPNSDGICDECGHAMRIGLKRKPVSK